MESRKILVVDDEPIVSHVCACAMESAGFVVDTACSGEVAKSMVAQTDYALCLVDIKTPVINGFRLYRYLKKAMPDLADKVVFTRGDTLNSNMAEFLSETGQPCLVKPFTPTELRKAVSEALN